MIAGISGKSTIKGFGYADVYYAKCRLNALLAMTWKDERWYLEIATSLRSSQ